MPNDETDISAVLPDFLCEDVLLVVDDDPAHPPAGDQEPLGEPPAAQHRHLRAQGGDRDIHLNWTFITRGYPNYDKRLKSERVRVRDKNLHAKLIEHKHLSY